MARRRNYDHRHPRVDFHPGGSVSNLPLTPTGLAASASGKTSVIVTWNDVSNNEWSFRVQRYLSDWVDVAIVSENQSLFVDTALTAGTTYQYRVRSENVYGVSDWTTAVSVTTVAAAGAPTAPSALTATPINTTAITVAWTDNSTDETGFAIERRQGTNAFALIYTAAVNATAYVDTGLTPATAYDYQVKAKGTETDSAYTSIAHATTNSVGAVPTAPSGLVATVVSNVRVNLVWNDNSSDETGFVIDRQVGSSGYVELTTPAAGATSYSDTSCLAKTVYTYRIKARNAIGDSTYAYSSAVTTEGVPSSPTDLIATATGQTTVTLAWTDNSSDETGFRVDRRLYPSGSYSLIHTTAADVETYDDTGLAAGTQYQYMVRAVNTYGSSADLAVAVVTTQADTVPTAPTGLTLTVVNATAITLAWTDNATNETSFYLDRSTDGGVTFPLTQIVAANTVTYTWTGLVASTTYTFRVRAANATGYSAPTLSVSAKTLPAAPSALVATQGTSNTINLTWTDNSTDETSFSLERSATSGSGYSVVATPAAGATTYTDTGLTASTPYYYRIRAVAAQGNSAYSAEATATTAPSGSLNTINLRGTVYSINNHPRVCVTPARIAAAPAKANTGNGIWRNLVGTFVPWATPANVTNHYGTSDALALMALYYGDPTTYAVYRSYAITILMNDITLEVSQPGNLGSIVLQSKAILYSMLHDYLTPTQRTQYRNYIFDTLIPYLASSQGWGYYKLASPPYEFNLVLTTWAAEICWALACCDEDSRGATLLTYCYDYWVDHLLPIYNVAYVGGHNYSGTQYGFGRMTYYLPRAMEALENTLVGVTGWQAWGPASCEYFLHTALPSNKYVYSEWETGQYTWDQGRTVTGWMYYVDKYKTLDVAKYLQHWIKNIYQPDEHDASLGFMHNYYLGEAFFIWGYNSPTAIDYASLEPRSYVATGTGIFHTRSAWANDLAVYATMNGSKTWGDHSVQTSGSYHIARNNTYIVIDNAPNYGAGGQGTTTPPSPSATCSTVYLGNGLVDGIETGGFSGRDPGSGVSYVNNHSVSSSYSYAMAVFGGAFHASYFPMNYALRRFTHFRPYNGSIDYFVIADAVSTTASVAKKIRTYVPENPTVSGNDATVTITSSATKGIFRKILGDSLTNETPVSYTTGTFPQETTDNVHRLIISNTATTTADKYIHVWAVGSTVTAAMPATTYLTATTPSGALHGVLLDDPKMARVYLGSTNAATIGAVNVVVPVPYTSTNGYELVVSDLTPATKYTVTYAAGAISLNVNASATTLVDSNGVFAYISGTAGPGGQPDAPTSCTATVISNVVVNVAWSDNPTTETGFELECDTAGGGYTQIATPAANANAYSHTGRTPSTQYQYRIRSVNANGASGYTTSSAVTTYGIPAAPSGLGVTAINTTALNVAWTDNSSNEANFELERKTTGSFAQVNVPAANTTYFIDTGLNSATTYTYRIRSNNAYGLSSYSSEASGTTNSAGGVAGANESITGAVAAWYFNEASSPVIDAVGGIVLAAAGTDTITYNVATTQTTPVNVVGYSPGCNVPINAYFGNATSGVAIGTSDFNVYWVGKMASYASGSIPYIFSQAYNLDKGIAVRWRHDYPLISLAICPNYFQEVATWSTTTTNGIPGDGKDHIFEIQAVRSGNATLYIDGVSQGTQNIAAYVSTNLTATETYVGGCNGTIQFLRIKKSAT